MRSLTTWILLLLLTSSISPAVSVFAGGRGGGMDSGGSDNKDVLSGVAWFLGNRTVHYCIDLAPDFGVTKLQAKVDIESAFATWNDYISAKRIFENMNRTDLSPTREQYKEVHTAHAYQFSDLCDGTQDLVFHLGTLTPAILEQKKFYENPTAFVYRESFDVAQGWGKGWIWVSPPNAVFPDKKFPDWTLPERLHGTLLHEIGHILGNGHVPGTIMQEDLTYWMLSDPVMQERDRAVLTHIDDAKELYICRDCPFSFEGELGVGFHTPQSAEDTFPRLLGRSSVGNIQARFEYSNQGYRLSVSDELGKTDFEIRITDPGADFELAKDVFRMTRVDPVSVEGPVASQIGLSSIGQLTIQGKTETVLIDRNSDVSAPLVISLLDGGKRVQIFTASLQGF